MVLVEERAAQVSDLYTEHLTARTFFSVLVGLRGVLSQSSLCCAHIYLSNAHTRWLKLGLKLKV